MLVLARKKGESIVIGDGIEITVLSSEGDTVKLGVTAPKHVEIHRKEVYEAIQKSNEAAVRKHVDVHELAKLLGKGPKNGGK